MAQTLRELLRDSEIVAAFDKDGFRVPVGSSKASQYWSRPKQPSQEQRP